VTALTAVPAYRAGLVWNTWRQHRLLLIGLLGAFAASAIVMLAKGLPAHAAHDSYLAHYCLTARDPICRRLLGQMGNSTWVLGFLPWLTAVFAGAPLVAREFDTGAFRFALAQGVGARRQLAVKLVSLGAVVVAGGVLLGLLAMWCQDPLLRIGMNPWDGISRWYPGYFHFTAMTLPAWTLFALCLGVLAGALVKHVVAAMAVALACVILASGAAAGVAGGWSSPGLGAPFKSLTDQLLTVAPVPMRGGVPSIEWCCFTPRRAIDYRVGWPGPRGSLQVSGWFTGPGGQRLSGPAALALAWRMPVPILRRPARVQSWLAARHITYWIGYQPASRFWLFQAVVAAMLVALAAGAGLIAMRLVGRRG
jgi:hypothetical protein